MTCIVLKNHNFYLYLFCLFVYVFIYCHSSDTWSLFQTTAIAIVTLSCWPLLHRALTATVIPHRTMAKIIDHPLRLEELLFKWGALQFTSPKSHVLLLFRILFVISLFVYLMAVCDDDHSITESYMKSDAQKGIQLLKLHLQEMKSEGVCTQL